MLKYNIRNVTQKTAAKAKKITDKLQDKNISSSIISLINSDTESSASNNASLGSNHKAKHNALSVNSIKKVPFSEIRCFEIWYGEMD